VHPGPSLHEESMELYTILAVLFGYALVRANAVGTFTATAVVLHRSNTLAVLLDNSHTVYIHDRYADRLDDNATRDWEEGEVRRVKNKYEVSPSDLFETFACFI